MHFPDISPVIFSFGVFHISYYSLSYVLGLLLGSCYAKYLSRRFHLLFTPEKIDSYISWFVISLILGGRLGYVLFYNPSYYFSHPIEIFKTYEGGMSFHGAIVGIVIGSIIFCKKNRLSFFDVTDLISAVAPIGLFLGRIANFINAELYGKISDLPWAVIFPYSDGKPRHPSQIYEALLEGLLLFLLLNILIFYRKALLIRSHVTSLFLIFYAIFRILIEFVRDSEFIYHYFTMGQILSIPMLVFGCCLHKKSTIKKI